MGGMDGKILSILSKKENREKSADPIGLKADYAVLTGGEQEISAEEREEFVMAEKDENGSDFVPLEMNEQEDLERLN